MPCNNGTIPDLDKVDLMYRSGVIQRNIEPRMRRWSISDPDYPSSYDWEIIWWQKPKPADALLEFSHEVASAEDLARCLVMFNRMRELTLVREEPGPGEFSKVA